MVCNTWAGGMRQRSCLLYLREGSADRPHTHYSTIELIHSRHRLYEIGQTINMNTHNQIFFKGEMWYRSQSQLHLAPSPKPTLKPLPLSPQP